MCLSPSIIHQEIDGEYFPLPVNCNRCWQCSVNRVNDFVGRSLAEKSVSDWVATLTLTYAPKTERQYDLADKVSTPKHFQAFVRSLRDRAANHKTGQRFRYICAGEYGELRGRAHFHAVLFGKGARPEWPDGIGHDPAWPHGHIFFDNNADGRHLRYVLKYISKEYNAAWFSMSKKPPIGHEWFQAKARKHIAAGVLPVGFQYHPPGGDNRKYLMTGATRQKFFQTIFDEWPGERDQAFQMANEWVGGYFQKLWQKYRQQQQIQEEMSMNVEQWLERLDKRRISDAGLRYAIRLTEQFEDLTNDPPPQYAFQSEFPVEGSCR